MQPLIFASPELLETTGRCCSVVMMTCNEAANIVKMGEKRMENKRQVHSETEHREKVREGKKQETIFSGNQDDDMYEM